VGNPFVYGEIAPVTAFVDREGELERLSADLLDGQKVFLISPRRYGKSSLIRHALRGCARSGALTVEVTVSSYSSYVAFLEGFTRALVGVGGIGATGGNKDTRMDRARSWVRELVGGLRPEVRYELGGTLEISFPQVRTARDVSRLAADVFALPARIARDRGRRLAVALDEFQAIAAFDGGSVEHALRAAVERQREVGYVFAGSEPALMERMIGRSRPFYKAGPVMRLGKIPADRFAAFVESRFARSGVRPEAGLGQAVLELAGNLPYDVQRLAHEAWDDARAAGRKRIGLDDLHHTLKRLLGEQDMLFETVWQRLTLAQRAALRAAVLADGRELLAADVRTRHRLGGASTVQAALAALVREAILTREEDRYVVVDSLFREWVARRTF
jgi:hypothetical protein